MIAAHPPMPLPSDIRLADDDDVPALRQLVNSAYQELAAMGLNFTGTYQDDEVTRHRMRAADVYVVAVDGAVVASINVAIKPREDGTPCLYINQLAVRPDMKRRGLGSRLLHLAEERARHLEIAYLRLDTAIPAHHLVALYERRGYRVISQVQWRDKTYRSCIMEKPLSDSTY